MLLDADSTSCLLCRDVGLSELDVASLSDGHTIGRARCSVIASRLYNFSNWGHHRSHHGHLLLAVVAVLLRTIIHHIFIFRSRQSRRDHGQHIRQLLHMSTLLLLTKRPSSLPLQHPWSSRWATSALWLLRTTAKSEPTAISWMLID